LILPSLAGGFAAGRAGVGGWEVGWGRKKEGGFCAAGIGVVRGFVAVLAGCGDDARVSS